MEHVILGLFLKVQHMTNAPISIMNRVRMLYGSEPRVAKLATANVYSAAEE